MLIFNFLSGNVKFSSPSQQLNLINSDNLFFCMCILDIAKVGSFAILPLFHLPPALMCGSLILFPPRFCLQLKFTMNPLKWILITSEVNTFCA